VTDDELHFIWDRAKAASNRRKHGVSFEFATFVFDDPHFLEEPDVFSHDEYRNIAVGSVDGLLLTVVSRNPKKA
jgi:uncharacterized DUF497 family protein